MQQRALFSYFYKTQLFFHGAVNSHPVSTQSFHMALQSFNFLTQAEDLLIFKLQQCGRTPWFFGQLFYRVCPMGRLADSLRLV